MGRLRASVEVLSTKKYLETRAVQKPDERYNPETRVPPPTRPPVFTTPQHHQPPRGGENSSYYGAHPSSPFPPTTNSPAPQQHSFAPSQGWNQGQGFSNTQQHNSPLPFHTGYGSYQTSSIDTQHNHQQYPYTATNHQGSPGPYHQSPEPTNPNPPSQTQYPPPTRSWTDHQDYQHFPAPIQRSYTVPVQQSPPAHYCADHTDP
jgi:hypothetical protein